MYGSTNCCCSSHCRSYCRGNSKLCSCSSHDCGSYENPACIGSYFYPDTSNCTRCYRTCFCITFLFACNNNTHTTVRTTATPGYNSYGFYSPVYTADPYYHGHYDTGSTVYVNNDHSHGHPSSHGTVHTHDNSHMHEHGGSHRHGHF